MMDASGWRLWRIAPSRWAAAVALAGVLMTPPPVQAGDFDTAYRLYQQRDYPQAIAYFRKALAQDPQNPNTRYYLADTLVRAHRLLEAQQEYQQILALAPESQAARLARLGLASLVLPVQSARRWSMAGQERPATAGDKLSGDFSGPNYLEAMTDNGKYVRWSLSTLPLRLYIEPAPVGVRNFEQRFVAEIRRAFDVWVKGTEQRITYLLVSDPRDANIRVTWVNALESKGQTRDGETRYTAGVTLPTIVENRLMAMDIRMATFDIMKRPQTADKIHAVAIHEIGHALGLLGHSDDPQDIMYAENRNRLTLSPRDRNTLLQLYALTPDISNAPPSSEATASTDATRQERIRRKLDEEIQREEALVKQAPSSLNWKNLGNAYFQKGKAVAASLPTQGDHTPLQAQADDWYRKALNATDKALELEPQDDQAYHNRAVIYWQVKDLNAAYKNVQQALQLNNAQALYHLDKASILTELKRFAEARTALQDYLLRNPADRNGERVRQIEQRLAQAGV